MTLGRGRATVELGASRPLPKFSQSKKGRFVNVGRYSISDVAEEHEDGAFRLRFRRGGESFAPRFLLCKPRRSGVDTGVENASGAIVDVVDLLKRIVDGMVKKPKFGMMMKCNL